MRQSAPLLFALVVLIFTIIRQCQMIGSLEDDKSTMLGMYNNAISGASSFYGVKKNIVEQGQNIVELTKQQQKLLLMDEDLQKGIKRLQAKVSIGTEIRYVDVSIPIDTNRIIKNYIASKSTPEKDSTEYSLRLPYVVRFDNKWISFVQEIDTSGNNNYRNLVTRDSMDFYLGDKKKKIRDLFKPRQYVINVVSHNPHSTVVGLNNIVNKPKTPFYKKPIVVSVASAVAAFILGIKMYN